MKKLFSICFFVCLLGTVFAQGDIDDQIRSSIRNEQTFHLMLSSNGWGGGFSYAKSKSAFEKKLWNVEMSYIKHPKELRISNPYYPDAKRFVFGKMNQVYNFRFSYGTLNRMFDKKDKGGIEIRWYYLFGPTVALLKPVYYEIRSADGSKIERFSRSNHLTYQDIYGGASFFKGFSELSVVPGLHGRIASSFEFSKKEMAINALECGLTLDLYPKKIELMANDLNQFYFFGFFINYRFGEIVNPRTKHLRNEANDKE